MGECTVDIESGDCEGGGLSELMRDASARQIVLYVADERLRYRGPPGSLTRDLRKRLEVNRDRLIEGLKSPAFRSRTNDDAVPIADHHHGYWSEIRSGAFDVGFINGTHFVLKVQRRFDRVALDQRIRALLARHSILRSHVAQSAEGVYFRDSGIDSVVARVVNLAECSSLGNDLQAAAGQSATDLVWEPFDESTGPMMRIFAVVPGATEYILGVVVHHFICDGLSLRIILNDLILDVEPRAPTLQFSDYVFAMNEWARGPGVKLRLEYWKVHLRDAPPTRLPPDHVCESGERAEVHTMPFSIDESTVNALTAFTRAHKTTLFLVLLSAKILALSMASRNPDIVLLIQHAGRDDPGLFGVVGSVTDRLPIRIRAGSASSFDDLLILVRETVSTAHCYQVPYFFIEKVAAEVGASDIIPAINFVDSASGADSDVEHPEIFPFAIGAPSGRKGSPRKHSSHWMNLVWSGAGIHGQIGYSPLIYRKETVEGFLRVFQRVLRDAATHAGVEYPA